MRVSVQMLALLCACVVGALVPSRAHAQHAGATDPVLRARTLRAGSPLKMFIPSGTVRLVGWDRDSLVIRGRVPSSGKLMFGGSDTSGYKLVIEQRDGGELPESHLLIYVPRRSQLSLKTADAIVDATDVSGWFYTVSGRYHIDGAASSLDVEAMSGDIDLEATTPYARAKTGKGHLVVRGTPQDVDASTIGGMLDIAASSIMHGRFTSVTGDIHYASAIAPHALFELSTHSGTIDLLLPRDVSARLELSTVDGEIDNGFTSVRPAAAGVHNLRLSLGAASADITVRTFKGKVLVRSR